MRFFSSLFLTSCLTVLALLANMLPVHAVLVLPEYRPGENQSLRAKPASILINAPARQLFLLDGAKRVLKTYPVAVGRPGFPTPEGQFKVTRLVKHPGFENPYKPSGASRISPGRNNPLGTRWIGFHPVKNGEYGIHGTNRPSSIGRFASHGCVRMYVKDAENLFNHVSFNMPVVVSYDRTLVLTKGDGVFLTIAQDPFGRHKRGTLGEVTHAMAAFYPKAELLAPTIQRGLAQKGATQLKIGTLPDPDEYNKIIETSVQARIPGMNIQTNKATTQARKHTDY